MDTPTGDVGLGGTITGIAVEVLLTVTAVVGDLATTVCVVGVGCPADVVVWAVAATETTGATFVDVRVVFKVVGVGCPTD